MDTAEKSSLPKNAVFDIISKDQSPSRFEDFCCDLLSVAEQRDYLPTSRSWDLGRDARTVPTAEGHVALACCSTTGRFEPKARGDLARVLKFATPHSLRFCSSQPLTEKNVHEIEDDLRRTAPYIPDISILSGAQLTALVLRYSKPFQSRYLAEIIEYRNFLYDKAGQTRELQMTGLRVALATQFHDDAQSLRNDLLRTLILKAVSDNGSYTPRRLAKWISDALHLPRLISPEFFADALENLVGTGALALSDEAYLITPMGEAENKEIDAVGENRLSRGRNLIRGRVNTLLGDELDVSSFDVLWKRVQDELATVFYFNGLRVMSAIASLSGGGPQPGPRKPLSELFAGIRGGITTTGVGGARAEEVAQAVVDLFDDRESESFAWLTDLAVKYVGICSLGLEPTAQQAVVEHLQSIDLVVDTDVVLSFLSPGERPHSTVEELLRRWVGFGGHVLITPPVLEETAYHAWISDNEYQDTWRDLSRFPPNEVHRYAGNAFVRAFAAQCAGDFSPKRWMAYVNEFRGLKPYDNTKIIAILKEDESFDVVEEFPFDPDFAGRVRDRIFALRKIDCDTYIPKAVGDKVWRDASLVAFLRTRRSDPRFRDRTTVLVSSSPVMQRAASHFEGDLGEPWAVWSIGAVTYLLALVPGVHMTMGTLRNCLFDEGDADAIDRITRVALRVIQRSHEYELGFSRRATLKAELRRNVATMAKQRGQRSSELAENLLEPTEESKELLTEVIAGAVDQLAASRSEREMAKLRKPK